MYMISFLLTLEIKQVLNRNVILNVFYEYLLKYAAINLMDLSLLEKPSTAHLLKN